MIRLAGFAFLVVCSAVSAHEDLTSKIDGDWAGKGSGTIDMRVMVLDAVNGIAAASIAVASAGCGGEVVGLGRLNGGVLAVSPYVKEEGGESCVVSIRFDASGRKGVISENSCGYYHGAACAFEGKLQRR